MKISLLELSERLDLEYRGNPEHTIESVATLKHAQGDQLSFLANSQYKKDLPHSQAGIVILDAKTSQTHQGNCLISKNPYLSYARAAQILYKSVENKPAPGIHPSAVVDPSAMVDQSAYIGPLVSIAAGAIIGAHCQIQASVNIGENVKLGEEVLIHAGARIEKDTEIGERCIIQSGAVLGGDGFGFAHSEQGWVKIPQTGRVLIGADCEIGANTTIDRGAIEDTIIGHGVKLDNQIQIGHNVVIGAHTIIAGCTAIAGSAIIGSRCLIGGGAGIVGHIEICDDVTIQAMALVTHSIKQPGSYSSVTPLQETSVWRKNAVRYRQLDRLAKQISHLEKKYE